MKENKTAQKNKSQAKDKSETKDKERPMLEFAEQAARNYEQALRAGVRLQEQAGQWWSTMLKQTAPAYDWQKPLERMGGTFGLSAAPFGQRQVNDTIELMEESGKANSELIKKAMDTVQATSPADFQERCMDLWEASLAAMQKNTETLTQIQSRTINSWKGYMRSHSEVTEVRVPKAA